MKKALKMGLTKKWSTPFWYGFWKDGGPLWHGDRTQTTVWNFQKDYGYLHPTQKPVELSAKAVGNSSKRDDAVLDLFGGSGSTLIACEQTNRHCYMMELDPRYCQIIIERWQKLTGKEATILVKSGENNVPPNSN